MKREDLLRALLDNSGVRASDDNVPLLIIVFTSPHSHNITINCRGGSRSR